jgi:hypothetical protein
MAEKEKSKITEYALKAVGWAVVIGIGLLGLKYLASKI